MATVYVFVFLYSRGRGSRFSHLWAGLAAGGGVLVDYQVAFIGPLLFLYVLAKGQRIWPRLRGGLLFGLGVFCKQDYGAAILVALGSTLAVYARSGPPAERTPALTASSKDTPTFFSPSSRNPVD